MRSAAHERRPCRPRLTAIRHARADKQLLLLRRALGFQMSQTFESVLGEMRQHTSDALPGGRVGKECTRDTVEFENEQVGFYLYQKIRNKRFAINRIGDFQKMV